MNKLKNNGVIYYSIDFKKKLWEDPKELGNVLSFMMNSILGDVDAYLSRQEKPKLVFTEFKELRTFDKLCFDFECYDVADEDEEKIYMSKLNDEDRESYELGKSWEKQDGR